ncbi:MAG: D-sedoheptulose 7-phosphate isomerase [Candidatus Aureabacteria bacterium]|nr:D-sedoheptulose 7-phosphate isomerase [Candidatus Auribacterota bacterium]
MKNLVNSVFREHLNLVQSLLEGESAKILSRMADIIVKALQKGNKVIFFGNGGSAADSQHLAAEFVGRFQKERKALPAISLTVNTSHMTAIANDYSFDIIFERQIEALAKTGDVSLGISTSGGSKNVIRAQEKAKAMGLKTLAFIGEKKSPLEDLCDAVFKVPSPNTARVQECHILAGHILCLLVESTLFGDE